MPKVSIIVPTYQAEKYAQRFIDSVLKFEHKNIELIIINDGSTDRTNEIIEFNKKRIEDAGIEFKYINLKENRNQSNALNLGLKLVTGEYLAWLDIDDLFLPNCLTKSLEALKANPDCKIVFSKAWSVKEIDSNNFDNNSNYIYFQNKKFEKLEVIPRKEFIHKNLFIDYIKGKNVIWAPMRFVETKALFNVLKDKSIYVNKRGQNAQIFLPMTYKYKWVYIDEVLSYYVIYENSHSHSNSHYSLRFEFEKLICNTINRINMPLWEKFYYLLITKNKFLNDDWRELKHFIRNKFKKTL